MQGIGNDLSLNLYCKLKIYILEEINELFMALDVPMSTACRCFFSIVFRFLLLN